MKIVALPNVVDSDWSVDALRSKDQSESFAGSALQRSKLIGNFGTLQVYSVSAGAVSEFTMDPDNRVVWFGDQTGQAVVFSEIEESRLKFSVDVPKELRRVCHTQVSIQKAPWRNDVVGVGKWILDNVLCTRKSNALTDRCQTVAGAAMWRSWVKNAMMQENRSTVTVYGLREDNTGRVDLVTQLHHDREVGLFLSEHFINDQSIQQQGKNLRVLISRRS